MSEEYVFIEKFEMMSIKDFHKMHRDWLNKKIGVGLRFGQYICNTYLKEGRSFPELYYEFDDKRVFKVLKDYADKHFND